MSTNTETNDQAVEHDALAMSDDAFADIDPSAFESYNDSDDVVGEEAYEEDADTADEDAEPEAEADESDGGEEDDENTEESGSEDTDSGDETENTDDATDDTDADTTDESEEVDFKSEYEKLMSPFKANGKDMKVDSIDDARQLMQMGANYNKKMAALKPSLKTLKLLEKNELLDESKLSYLIDLHKGDKGAIQKLIKDSGIDPLDYDSESDSDYKPKTYTVDDREVELDDVLERIQDTPSYSDTINVVSNKWDAASKQYVANNPTALETINNHMASGVYARVSAEVEKQRTFGRLNGLSDMEAYHKVGYTMSEEGALNDLVQSKPEPTKKVVQPRKTANDLKLKEKKRAASSTRNKPAKKAEDFNPLSMSDEAYEKAMNENLL